MLIPQSRRRFMTKMAYASALGLGGFGFSNIGRTAGSAAGDAPPEITTVRVEMDPVICNAPQVFEELLRAEGFTDVRYIQLSQEHVQKADAVNMGPVTKMLADGEVDFARDFAATLILSLEAKAQVTILTGLHLGCFEVFAKNDIQKVSDLRGKTVGYGVGDKPLLTILANFIGLDPKEVNWYPAALADPIEAFAAGKIDAYLFLPPALQEVKSRNIGHVLASQIVDRPWSQYYCCMLATRTEFARKYPVATKRVMRAVLKGADLCASEPKQTAERLVGRGSPRYDYALQMLNEVRFDVWRDYDPEDTVRFYSLRLQEVGEIRSSPQQIINNGTDWRFLNELKHELKV